MPYDLVKQLNGNPDFLKFCEEQKIDLAFFEKMAECIVEGSNSYWDDHNREMHDMMAKLGEVS